MNNNKPYWIDDEPSYTVRAETIDSNKTNPNIITGYLWLGNDHAYIIPYDIGINVTRDKQNPNHLVHISTPAIEIKKETIRKRTPIMVPIKDTNSGRISKYADIPLWENDTVKLSTKTEKDIAAIVVFNPHAASFAFKNIKTGKYIELEFITEIYIEH